VKVCGVLHITVQLWYCLIIYYHLTICKYILYICKLLVPLYFILQTQSIFNFCNCLCQSWFWINPNVAIRVKVCSRSKLTPYHSSLYMDLGFKGLINYLMLSKGLYLNINIHLSLQRINKRHRSPGF